MEKINKFTPAIAGVLFVLSAITMVAANIIFIDYYQSFVNGMLVLFVGMISFLGLLDKKAAFVVAGYFIITAIEEIMNLMGMITNIISFGHFELDNILSCLYTVLLLMAYFLIAGDIITALIKSEMKLSKLRIVILSVVILLAVGLRLVLIVLNIQSLGMERSLMFTINYCAIIFLMMGAVVTCAGLNSKKMNKEGNDCE